MSPESPRTPAVLPIALLTSGLGREAGGGGNVEKDSWWKVPKALPLLIGLQSLGKASRQPHLERIGNAGKGPFCPHCGSHSFR